MVGLLASAAAALCYGAGTVLQAIGARRTEAEVGIHPRLLVRLAAQRTFVLGTVLDVLGFALALLALHHLPLYVVQVAVAANLAVSAVLAARMMHADLSGQEWAGVAAVTVGLGCVGLSAGESSPAHASDAFRWGLVIASGAVILAGLLFARIEGPRGAAVLGFVSGLAFGIVSLAGRVLDDLRVADLMVDGALWALVVAGIVGFLLHAVALQRGSVTTATAGVVLGETIVPVVIGIVMLHDSTRPGFGPLAVIGVVLALGGALVLSRFGELEPSDALPSATLMP